jgi:hypothetical protein
MSLSDAEFASSQHSSSAVKSGPDVPKSVLKDFVRHQNDRHVVNTASLRASFTKVLGAIRVKCLFYYRIGWEQLQFKSRPRKMRSRVQM